MFYQQLIVAKSVPWCSDVQVVAMQL
jgi:hypothetical protein